MIGFSFEDTTGLAARHAARLAQARIAVRMRAASRIVVLPALAAMLWGLILFWATQPPAGPMVTAEDLSAMPTVALNDLFGSDEALTPQWWLSLGLLALIALPAINVGLALRENVRLRRWADVGFAAGILAILLAGALAARR